MIHYFNPGHETAVLNASKHYQPPAHIVKMQTDLAFLPAWYASAGDFVFMETVLPDDFILSCKPFNLQVSPVIPGNFSGNRKTLQYSTIDLWGISPQSIHFFEKLNQQWELSLAIPRWKEEFHFLGSRFASQKLLTALLNRLPEADKEILPHFVSDMETIEQQIAHSQERLLIKSPYSSSGRGLIWLFPGNMAQSEKQILSGILKRQQQVSIEKALDKQLDFSMQFENTVIGETRFIGYSIFKTNAKGAYERSSIDSQERLEKRITNWIDANLLLQTRTVLTKLLQEMYVPYYTGIIGVDMLIYKAGGTYRLHPCIEINMRKNMGYLAIRLFEKYLHPDSQGELFIEYHVDSKTSVRNHRQLQTQFPLIIEDGRICNGYLSLCPITDSTNYRAYVRIKRKDVRLLHERSKKPHN